MAQFNTSLIINGLTSDTQVFAIKTGTTDLLSVNPDGTFQIRNGFKVSSGGNAISANGSFPIFSQFGGSIEGSMLGITGDISVGAAVNFKNSGFSKIVGDSSQYKIVYTALEGHKIMNFDGNALSDTLLELNNNHSGGTAKLFHVVKTGDTKFVIDKEGLVGIGNSAPTEILNIYKTGFSQANIVVESDSHTSNLILNSFKNSQGTSGGSHLTFKSGGVTKGDFYINSAGAIMGIDNFQPGGAIQLFNNSYERIYLGSNLVLLGNNAAWTMAADVANGRVGIGPIAPQEKLHITGGTIRIETANGTQGAGKLMVSDANGSISFSSTTALGLGGVNGTGTAGTLTKWLDSTTLTNSLLSESGTGVTVNGSVQIYGNVDILGTATTFNTQTIQTADNNITLNLSGSHVSALYGGITVLSGKTDNTSSTWTIDSNGGWSANSYCIFTGLRSDNAGNTLISYNSAGTNTFLVRDDGFIGINTNNPQAQLNIDRTNDGVELLKLTSDNEVVFSARRGAITALANSYTFSGGGGGTYTFIANTNPTLVWNTIGLGETLSIGGSIPTIATTRPAFVIDSPLVGVGIGYPEITAKLHSKGADFSSANFGLKVDNSTGSTTLGVRNDSKVIINTGDTSFYTSGGYAVLDVENYRPFKIRNSSIGFDFMTFSHTTAQVNIAGPTLIRGGINPSQNCSLEVGTYGSGGDNVSSIGVRKIALSNSAGGWGVFGIGSQSDAGSFGAPTMRFVYTPLTYGYSAETTNNNLFRIGIGADVENSHRVIIADGLKVSGLTIVDSGSTYGAGKIAISDSLGNISFSSTTSLGISSSYATTLTTPGANVTNTITHNLGTTDISVSLWLVTTGDLTSARVTNRTTNTVDVIFSSAPGEDVRVVIK